MTTREAIIKALAGRGWRRGADVMEDVYRSGCSGTRGKQPKAAALMALGRMVKDGTVEKKPCEGWTTHGDRQVYVYRLVTE